MAAFTWPDDNIGNPSEARGFHVVDVVQGVAVGAEQSIHTFDGSCYARGQFVEERCGDERTKVGI